MSQRVGQPGQHRWQGIFAVIMTVAFAAIFAIAFDSWLLGVVVGVGAGLGAFGTSVLFARSQPTMPDDSAD
jgi:hypothetical protein